MPKGICCNLRILKCVSNDVLILFYEQNFLFLFSSQIILPLTLLRVFGRYQMHV